VAGLAAPGPTETEFVTGLSEVNDSGKIRLVPARPLSSRPISIAMTSTTRLPTLLAFLTLLAGAAQAVTLRDYAQQHPLRLFAATKGVVMPNSTDQTNNLGEGDRALLLSGRGLTDITGISTLLVEDGGRQVSIAAVKNLHLFFNQNQIASLPDEIGALKNVIFLYFEQNNLRDLPRALAQMDSLVGMYYTANAFTEIPAFVFDLTRLKKLQFSKNEISELPAALGQLTELRHLNLAGNRIAVVPESISRLTRLRVCDLSDNRIRELPEAFGQVQIVNQLRVRNNPLTRLPAGFATMRATIDITGTKIDPDRLPPEMRAKISTEKPPGSKEPDKIIVASPRDE
jgi:Leucine-rich repeat (LRR) protein